MKSRAIGRIRFLSFVMVGIAALLTTKLYFVQIVHGDAFSERADRQYVHPNQNFNRGSVYFADRKGNLLSAATLKSGFIISINPNLLEEPGVVYTRVGGLVNIDRDVFLAKAEKEDDPYEEIARRVPEEVAQKIQAMELPGVSVHREKWRYYPGESLASHVLGFVGYRGDKLSGRYGLEQYYDDILQRDQDDLYVNFFAELFANVSTALSKPQGQQGSDLVLTIEPSVQSFLESQLERVQKKWGSASTGGIIINPQNGEIYAMTVEPDFDPNLFYEEKNTKVFTNPLIEGVYEMGSIIKPLTMAAALDAKAVTPETMYEDRGSLTLNGAKISNFDGKARGRVSMQEVLSQSLNTGVTFAVQKMGYAKFAQYMFKYGLGEETGIDLPNEAQGLMDNLKSPRDIEYATASFGQGVAFTPIATVRALSSLANGGVLITPHVTKRVQSNLGFSRNISYPEGERVLSEETSEQITRMLVKVVDTALLDGTVKLEHYSVAAKTGTAEIAAGGGRGYYEDRYLHTFFGYFPAYDPKFLVFLYTREPVGARYASHTLTHPFIDITKFLLNYYEVPPDR